MKTNRIFHQPPVGRSEPNMRVELIAVCEESWDRAGGLDVLGSFDQITVPQLPCLYRGLKVVARLLFRPDEVGAHDYSLRVVDPRGRDLIDPQSSPLSADSMDADSTAECNVIVKLPPLPLQMAGEHRLDFHLDGRLEGRLPFYVREWELRMSEARAPALHLPPDQ